MSDIGSPWLSAESYWFPTRVGVTAWSGHAPFANWLIAAQRPRTVVELGTHYGFSYFVFCEAAERLGLDTRLWAVDSWEGDEHAGEYGQEVFDRVLALNEPYQDRSELVRGYFSEVVDQFEDGSVDLLHIDGRHLYEDAKEDFETYLPKVSDRGIVIFHDVCEKENGFGVYRFWDEIRTQYPSFNFQHSHGLGVILVGEDQTPEVRAFFDALPEQTDAIRASYEHLAAEVDRTALLEQSIDTMRFERDTAANRVVALETELEPLRTAHENDGARVERLQAKVRDLRSRLERQRAARQRLEQEMDDVHRSTSWKLTAPLRRVRRS